MNNSNDFWQGIPLQIEKQRIGGLDDRQEWVRIAHACKALAGEIGDDDLAFAIFHELSANSLNYRNEQDCKRAFQSCKNVRSIGVGSLIKHLRDNGLQIDTNNQQGFTKQTKIRTKSHFISNTDNGNANKEYLQESEADFRRSTSRETLKHSQLLKFFRRLFWGHDEYYNIAGVWRRYRVGYCWPHEVYRYYDAAGRLCKIKLSAHSEADGRRLKVAINGYSPIYTKPHNPVQCFFGEHLLQASPDAVVAVVEAEKTALMMAVIYPGIVWLATGGVGNLQACASRPALEGRRVLVCPDIDGLEAWRAIAHAHGWAVADERLNYTDCLQSLDNGDKADIADYAVAQYDRLNATPDMAAARSLAKNNPALWGLMQATQSHILINPNM